MGKPDKSTGIADEDIVSKLFGWFLPKPEDVGLSRYNRETSPESYYAVKDAWADKVNGDSGDLTYLRQLLAGTNLQYRPLQLAYTANRDGWTAKAFHERVDKKGPALVCAKIDGGVLGGYNPTGWVNYGEYRGSVAAFLFLFPDGDVKQRPIKLQKISGAGLAQVDDGSGPRFGAEGLTIPLQKPKQKLVRSKLGLYYEKLPNGVNSLLPGGRLEGELTDLQVYLGVYEKGEKIPYSDALPFALN